MLAGDARRLRHVLAGLGRPEHGEDRDTTTITTTNNNYNNNNNDNNSNHTDADDNNEYLFNINKQT